MKPRSSLPLPSNNYALEAARNQQIDLILPTFAAQKLSSSSPSHSPVKTTTDKRVLAPLPTLSQISARLQPVRSLTYPVPSGPTGLEGGGASRLPAFLLAKRLNERSAKTETAVQDKDVSKPDAFRMSIPVPTFTVTPPPERVEEGRKVRELLVGRLSARG